MSSDLTPTQLDGESARLGSSLWVRLCQQVPIYVMVCGLVLTFAALANVLTMDDGSTGARATSVMAFPLLAKLAMAAAATGFGAWALICSVKTRECLGTIPGILFAMLGVVFIVTSIFAYEEVRVISRSAALIYVGYLLFAATVASTLSIESISKLLLITLTVLMLVTWALFLFVPSVGVFYEYTTISTKVPRMGGTAHPNVIGREAAIAVLLSAGLLRSRDGWRRRPYQTLIFAGVIVLGLATLAATKSRTSTLALVVALSALLGDLFFTRRGIAMMGGMLVMLLSGVLVAEMMSDGEFLSDKILDKITKTGSADELTSATGRTDIWASCLELLAERPWTGWGLDSAASLGIEAASTHNLLLNITFSAGVVAGLIAGALLVWTAVYGLSSRLPVVRGVCAYLLISGLVEDTVLESFPATLTILWMVFLVGQAVDRSTGSDLGTGAANPSGIENDGAGAGGTSNAASATV